MSPEIQSPKNVVTPPKKLYKRETNIIILEEKED